MIKQTYKIFISVFALSTILLASSSAGAIEYGGVGGRPAYPRADNPRTESIFMHTAEPGSAIAEGVKIINNTSETKSLLVYAADSVVSSGGAFACAQKVDQVKDVGGWINLTKTELTLASLTNEIIPFDIMVPETADTGEHSGCIVIQESKAPTAGGNSGMQLSFRTAIRVSITIPGDIVQDLAILGFDVSKNARRNILFSPAVRNLGNSSVDADIIVTPRYFFGLGLKNKKAGGRLYYGGNYPILRGQDSSWDFEFNQAPIWGGLYNAKLNVQYKNSDGVDVYLASKTKWFFVVPTLLGALIDVIVLLVLILLIYALIIHFKRKRWIAAHWVDHKTKSGETINSIADHYNVSWKLIKKVNRLRPPYTLKSGEVIKVPPKSKK